LRHLNYQYNEVSFPGKGSDLLVNGQARCTELDCGFITRVVRLSLETIFSSRLSWINLIQYDNVSQTVGLNSRLHWIPQAGREGFLVLNHNVRDDPLTPDDDYHSSFGEVTLKYSYTSDRENRRATTQSFFMFCARAVVLMLPLAAAQGDRQRAADALPTGGEIEPDAELRCP
jgi:hypothetical protein